ncbi:MAG TPA: chromosomal replication initiator protein DnaA [Anaerolineales bacterium]|nr:chromosomal replication initiator protein DnaA [Anaerolineales bacterium]HRQ92684.1 chromosomal replication initiator protein DnaA [Anaerolineales bacterium]
MNANNAWQAALGQLQVEMPKSTFDTWVRDAEMVAYEDGSFVIGVNNAYARDWLESRLKSTVTRMLTGIMNRSVEVRFVVWLKEQAQQPVQAPQMASPVEAAPVVSTPEVHTSLHETEPAVGPQFGINSRYTFENFVVGSGNRLAHAASMSVAENPGKSYNPLFLYGRVGLGKTHLLRAIGYASQQRGLRVLYVSSEEFTNDLISAIRSQTTPAFRDKYRSADVLLIDDIQFIAGKESTQEEFFHTFNTLHGQNKQIVLTSDRSPKGFLTLEERLRSRFEWGLLADIQSPDYETRLAILRSNAEKLGRPVPAEVLEAIAERMQTNIRELEGALNRMVAYAYLRDVPLTVDLVDGALADMLPEPQSLSPETIVEAVARAFNQPQDKLLSRDRSAPVALARQVAMYLMREEARLSLPTIGAVLGGRDHTTVMHGCEKINELLETDERLRRQVSDLREQLYGERTAVRA